MLKPWWGSYSGAHAVVKEPPGWDLAVGYCHTSTSPYRRHFEARQEDHFSIEYSLYCYYLQAYGKVIKVSYQ